MKVEIENGKNPVPPKRSISLTKSEWKRLKEFIQSYDTPVDAAIDLRLDRNTMQRVEEKGKGSEKTITKIRNFFTPETIEA